MKGEIWFGKDLLYAEDVKMTNDPTFPQDGSSTYKKKRPLYKRNQQKMKKKKIKATTKG